MNKFIQAIALVFACAIGAEMVAIVEAPPAMAGNIPVMTIAVHPPCPASATAAETLKVCLAGNTIWPYNVGVWKVWTP